MYYELQLAKMHTTNALIGEDCYLCEIYTYEMQSYFLNDLRAPMTYRDDNKRWIFIK